MMLDAAQRKEPDSFRVLVAEDSRTQRQIIRSVLRGEGFDVMMASDGIEAVSQAFQEHPDLVVLDIEMPRMNGYQVCRLLKDDRRTAHIPIIMLTSRSQETDKFWGLKTGADRYVTKDFQLTGLAITVHELLRQEGIEPAPAPPEQPAEAVRSEYQEQEDVDVLSRVNDLLDRKLYEATIINEISKLNTLSQDCAVTLSSVLALIAKVGDCQVCAVFLVEEMELFMHVPSGVSKPYFRAARERALEASSGALPLGISPQQVKVTLDIDPEVLEEVEGSHQAVASLLSMPLTARGQLIAHLVLTSDRPDAFGEDITHVLQIVEYPLGLVVDNARLHEGTRKLAITDGLTRLFNHRHFYELLDRELVRSRRYKSNLTLVMIDIDSFKQINDLFGHQVGDEVLKSLAGVITSQVRDVDFVARYGGEEFALLLPQTELRDAIYVAERIRKAVDSHEFDLPDGGKVTISLGVAGFPECGAQTQNELVQIADAALYRAKEAGKNQVMSGGVVGAG